MTILIIGSKGFIGSHAVDFFKKKNCSVFECDVHTEYNSTNYFQIDISNSNFNYVFTSVKFDICINCSGAADVSNSLKNPHRDYALNTSNVFKILNSIQKNQPNCKFINLSSAAVYGNPVYLPINEKHPIKPVSPYGFHKLQSEIIVKEFAKIFNLKTCSLRIFSAFGPGLKKQLFWDLHKKSNLNDTVKLFGSGEETRDFIYINDLMEVLNLVFENHIFDGASVNVANGKEIKIKNAVNLFYNNYYKEINYIFSGENKKGYPINWKADISKLSKLGYKQKTTFEQGIKNYIEWLKNLK